MCSVLQAILRLFIYLHIHARSLIHILEIKKNCKTRIQTPWKFLRLMALPFDSCCAKIMSYFWPIKHLLVAISCPLREKKKSKLQNQKDISHGDRERMSNNILVVHK